MCLCTHSLWCRTSQTVTGNVTWRRLHSVTIFQWVTQSWMSNGTTGFKSKRDKLYIWSILGMSPFHGEMASSHSRIKYNVLIHKHTSRDTLRVRLFHSARPLLSNFVPILLTTSKAQTIFLAPKDPFWLETTRLRHPKFTWHGGNNPSVYSCKRIEFDIISRRTQSVFRASVSSTLSLALLDVTFLVGRIDFN